MIKLSKINADKLYASLFMVILLTLSYIYLFNSPNSIQNIIKEQNTRLKSNGFWNLTGSPIVIDGNDDWEDQNVLYDWISGNGLIYDPYIIENVVINGLDTTPCITIKNSDVYFVIINCTLYNCDSAVLSAGLILQNVSQGMIFCNNISANNYYGIFLDSCYNNSISYNNASSNMETGILLYNCWNNTVNNNRVEHNIWNGIEVASDGTETRANIISNNIVLNNTRGIYVYAENTEVLYNEVIDNQYDGIYIGSQHVLAMGNTANLNQAGICISWHDNNTIIANTLNDNSMHGITIWHSNYNYIENNNISGNQQGIYMFSFSGNSKNNTIINNRLIKNEYGIYMQWNNFNNTITGNLITNSSIYGIYLDTDCDWNYITDNRIYYSEGGGILLFGIVHSCDFNIISNNDVSKNYKSGASSIALFWCNNNHLIKNNCTDINNYAIHVYNSNDNLVIENTFLNDFIAIYIDSSNYTIVQGNNANNCTGSAGGIYIYNGWNNELLENNVNNNYIGILLYHESKFNEVHDNNVLNNEEYGIYLFQTEHNTVSHNRVSNPGNTNGIYLEASNSTTISSNYIESNLIGICLLKSNDNIIHHNQIYNNLGHGILLKSEGTGCFNNLFHDNIFIDNQMHAVDEQAANYWNNSVMGNYWDNYTGTDIAPKDGIGDTPHSFPGGIDYLPIWDDSAPEILILSPVDMVYGSATASSFEIMVEDLYLDAMWYTIDGGFTNVTFYTNGSINQVLWDAIWNSINEGEVISIHFYANDTFGHIGTNSVDIIKVIAPVIHVISPSSNQELGSAPPSFIIEISEDNIDTIWYSLDNGVTTYTITNNGTIDANLWNSIWNSLSDEDVVTIRFYVNDSYGLSAFDQIQVIIDKPAFVPSPSIPGYDWVLLVSSIIIGLIVLTFFRKRKI